MESEARLRSEEFAKSVHLLEFLGRRGTLELLMLFCCEERSLRFGQVSRTLRHVSTKTIAARLGELVARGLAERKAYNEMPPRVEYKLTQKGQALADSLMPIYRWIGEWLAPAGRNGLDSRQQWTPCPCGVGQAPNCCVVGQRSS